jgi:VCBS repeat-containing protein
MPLLTCSGEVYDHDGALALATKLLTQQVSADLGGGYVLVGQTKREITDTTLDAQGTVTLTVSTQGTWVYQFSATQELTLAQLIAGKSIQDAQQLLSQQQGVAQTSIKLSGSGRMLPSDPQKIKIIIQAIPGS